jgi:tRNA-Thr(GGU) m(6)t(6)A37 methyltransferase TsaA
MMGGRGEVLFIGTVESAGEVSTVRIFEEYCGGLLGIEGYSHLFVLYWLHLRDDERNRRTLRVVPRRHEGAPLTGVFACRSPSRPNPIGLTVVRLLSVEGCALKVSGLDAVEGTPVIDIKPYSPRADSIPDARTPEWTLRGPPT